MPRDTDMQQNIGEALDVGAAADRLMRGDLVFWKGHVGILRDPTTILHANAHHMLVASEPLHSARERILATSATPIAALRRLL